MTVPKTDAALIAALDELGCRAKDATCLHAQIAGDPGGQVLATPKPARTFCAYSFTKDGALRRVPNMEPSFAGKFVPSHLWPKSRGGTGDDEEPGGMGGTSAASPAGASSPARIPPTYAPG